MTAKQKLKFALENVALFQAMAKQAKKEMRDAERVRGKKLRPAKKASRRKAQRTARTASRRSRR